MQLILLAASSVACSLLAYIPAIDWISIPGLSFGIIAWVLAHKLRQSGQTAPYIKVFMVIAIIGTFASLFAVIFSYVFGTLLTKFSSESIF